MHINRYVWRVVDGSPFLLPPLSELTYIFVCWTFCIFWFFLIFVSTTSPPPGWREKTHSVFDYFLLLPTCISSPKRLKWLYKSWVPFTAWARDSNRKAAFCLPIVSTTNGMCHRVQPSLDCFQWVGKSRARWVVLPILNFALFNPYFPQSSSSVSANIMMRKRNSVGAIQSSPCLTQTDFPISHANFLFSVQHYYSYTISELRCRISWGHRIWKGWRRVVRGSLCQNVLTRSANTPHEGKLWLCLVCSIFLNVKDPSSQPTPGVEANWYLTPYFFTILNALSHNICPATNFGFYIPFNLRPFYLLGSARWPFFRNR